MSWKDDMCPHSQLLIPTSNTWTQLKIQLHLYAVYERYLNIMLTYSKYAEICI